MRQLAMMLFAVLLSIQPTTLLAAGIAIDESRGCEISVQYTVQTGPAANVAFRLYRVARCNSDGSLTMDNAFKGYPVVIDTTDSERMTALAMTLEGYVAKDHIDKKSCGSFTKHFSEFLCLLKQLLRILLSKFLQIE